MMRGKKPSFSTFEMNSMFPNKIIKKQEQSTRIFSVVLIDLNFYTYACLHNFKEKESKREERESSQIEGSIIEKEKKKSFPFLEVTDGSKD